jgi:flagellin
MSNSSIISNIAAFSAQGNIASASNKAASSISRLSSGNRIVRASDDVAGLATGTALRSVVTTLRQALSNASQGSSLLQVADGGLGQIIDILQRQKAIAVQAASGQLTDANRALLNQEFTALTAEVDRIATSTNFNGVNLLAGGLGSKTRQSTTAALAAAAVVAASGSGQTTGNGVITASTNAVQAFGTPEATVAPIAGASRIYALANGGTLQFVDSNNAALPAALYDTIDASVSGQFSKFQFSNVSYGAVGVGTGTLTATINGVDFVGNVVSAAQGTTTLRNGNTYIQMALGNVSFADASSTQLAQNNITNLFSFTTIMRTSTVQGVDFNGTRLAGAIGNATSGNASLRLNTNGPVDISDFKYEYNTGAANTSFISVMINGQKFTANNVNDAINAGNTLMFVDSGRNQALQINLTGLTTNITNIRRDVTDRTAFISALNQGFSRAGSGLNFAIGTAQTDSIRVQFGSTTTNSLYNGNALDISTAANAQAASNTLDGALTKAVSLRSTVGALQSRFNFASNAIQSAVENQDAARSRILDTDVSAESTAYASAQVQLQAGIAVLAQANQLPQNLLKLIG